MADYRPRQRGVPGSSPPRATSKRHEEAKDNASDEQRDRLRMQRGVSQLLFNYLPWRTVDWEDGLAIVLLEGVQLSQAWSDDQVTGVLEEIANLFDRWRNRGGTIDQQFPDPRTERGRFTVGLPQTIEASVLPTALVCSGCSRLSFPKHSEIIRTAPHEFRCTACGKRGLRQIPFVFVHGCGELVPIGEWIPATRRVADVIEPVNRPIRCPRCGPSGSLVMPLRTERVPDMKVVCQNCQTVVIDRFTARCHRCLREANPPESQNERC
jgi:hypothetical protein